MPKKPGNQIAEECRRSGHTGVRELDPGRFPSKHFSAAFVVALAFSLALAPSLRAQSDVPKPVPVLNVSTGFITTFDGGDAHLGPLVTPVLLVPFGDRWLFEARGTFESDLSKPTGSDSFRGVVEKEVDYAQLDFIANRYMTIVVGRFLTPFGIYNERLYPIWIRDLQSDPLILPISTGPSGAGTGGMLRGGFQVNSKVDINYAAYFSALSTLTPVDSNRAAGGRVGIYLPGPRFEFGGSFQHLLQDERSNSFGFHFAWQPPTVPLDVRAEYARSARGSGYWAESAYRLNEIPVLQSMMRRTQLVARAQQFFVGWLPDDDLPGVNTREMEFGMNYYLLPDLRFTSSYGRQFSAAGNANVWTLGFTYRFVTPLAGREKTGGSN